MNPRRKLNDLLAQRAQHLDVAQQAMNNGDQTVYETAMQQATALNGQIQDLQNLIGEEDRFAGTGVSAAPQRDLEAMGADLRAGNRVRFNVAECISGMGLGRRNVTTIDFGTIVQPVAAGSTIHPGFNRVSSLIDQVNVIDMTGVSGVEEPYEISDPEAQGGDVEGVSGTSRTATDPVFAKAALRPYEVSVTTFVDRSLSDLSPVAYAQRIQQMAMRGLRRKINDLITNGDGAGSPVMFGFLNAKNTAGDSIYKTVALGADITANTLAKLVFSYGGDEEVGGNARLILSKESLRKFAVLLDGQDRPVYKIDIADGNPNVGTITGGGVTASYTINSKIGDAKIAYGDPFNYELALFGDYSIRVDESYKAGERLHTILGDVKVGGNLVVHNGFVVGTLGA